MILALGISCFLLFPTAIAVGSSQTNIGVSEQKLVSKLSKNIEIQPGSDYYIKFTAQNLTLEGRPKEPYIEGLTEKTIKAIAKSPTWVQQALTRQFLSLNDTEPYADLLLNVSKQYTDEIAYSIAYSPLGNVPPAEVVKANAFSLYENDQWIQYADIIDYNDSSGNYYSTIRYNVLENGDEQQYEYPKDIYYQYVVSMKTGGENPEFVYNYFWRDYLFDHNDLGYPLLKEKLSTIQYLWDGESYNQPAYRLWTQSIREHPTAIEAVSYWISKTMNTPALGDRPNQPNIMAHEHNGYCGELQRLAVAAQRTALIPSLGICNIGEDHVWREFYERGWHQADNWWADTGGVVDQFDVYRYGWKKNMSAVFAWQPDDSIEDVTSQYIHSEDRITVQFVVKDGFLQPVDGARVVVLVKGLKDITWITHTIWEKIQTLYEKLPFGGRLLQPLYDAVKKRYNEIPEVINGLTISTWNYTDMNGVCTFELGKTIDYIFLVQTGNLRKPWQLARHNMFRLLRDHTDATFQVIVPDLSHRVTRYQENKVSFGNAALVLSFNTTAYQLQQSVKTENTGFFETNGLLDCFLIDTENFGKYMGGDKFSCFNFMKKEQGMFRWRVENKDWYLVFRNPARNTVVCLDLSLQLSVSTDTDHVQIVSPDTNVFEYPIIVIGDTIDISGVATDDVVLSCNGEQHEVVTEDDTWWYHWNTSAVPLGIYPITVVCGNAQDTITLQLIDPFPPLITIDEPSSGEIIENDVLFVSGACWDNGGIGSVQVAVDDYSYRLASGTTHWSINWDITGLELGDHRLRVRAVDVNGRNSVQEILFVVNETGHEWKPEINTVFHTPGSPTNTSNIIVYANVTRGSPFAIKTVMIIWNNATTQSSSIMYRYADNPSQERHEEDPLKNESNAPFYGCELGQFPGDESVIYWVVAVDTANNIQQSSEHSFTIPI